MARGNNSSTTAAAASRGKGKSTGALDLDSLFDTISAEASDPTRIPEPDWIVPNNFYCDEAKAFRDPMNGGDGDEDIDEAIVRRLVRVRYDKTASEDRNYAPYRDWFEAPKRLIVPPAKTCPGMMGAGVALNEALLAGERIAVYCDYDVDGTSGGAAFAAALAPYEPDLHFGFADAQAGFGLTDAFVQEAHAAGAKWLITLDCGTGQAAQVAHAQGLGMRVIVVDHHDVAENPADFHLNPKLYTPATSQNTGAQLAFKLGAATQIAREGRTRADLWEVPLKLAGLGALADMGGVLLPENRAFFWAAAEHVPPGYGALAAALGEDPTWPGQNVLTQAVLNLPKRTHLVSAADIFAVFSAPDADTATPIIERLLSAYEAAKPVRERMQAEALEQTGQQAMNADGTRVRERPEELVAFAVLDGYDVYAGYSGVVAGRVADKSGKPAFVVSLREERDSAGRRLAKFSGRPAYGCPTMAELAQDEEIQRLCTVERLDEAGERVAKATFGGHAKIGVFAGSVYEENIEALHTAIERVARQIETDRGMFFPPPYDGPSASVAERKVPAVRLAAAERDARRFGPYSKNEQLLYDPATGAPERTATHPEPKVSVMGRLRDLAPDPASPGWLAGVLDLGDGETRPVKYPADAEPPEGLLCEWVLRLGSPAPYWLRTHHAWERPPVDVPVPAPVPS